MELAYRQTYIFVVIECVEDVVGQATQQIDNEPRLQVVHSNDLWIANNFASGSDESGVEI